MLATNHKDLCNFVASHRELGSARDVVTTFDIEIYVDILYYCIQTSVMYAVMLVCFFRNPFAAVVNKPRMYQGKIDIKRLNTNKYWACNRRLIVSLQVVWGHSSVG